MRFNLHISSKGLYCILRVVLQGMYWNANGKLVLTFSDEDIWVRQYIPVNAFIFLVEDMHVEVDKYVPLHAASATLVYLDKK